jgi:threonine synthase
MSDQVKALEGDEQLFWVECHDCQTKTPFHPMQMECPVCGCDWRFARYDLERARTAFSTKLPSRAHDLWRYNELLPLSDLAYKTGLCEGWTPLFRAEQLGLLLGLDHLYIKDERQGPTRSFKDRQAAVSTAVLREHQIQEAVICSTGNVAIAFSATCARMGITLWAFLTSLVPPEKMHEVAIYGTKIVKVTGTYDEAKQLAAEFAQKHELYIDRGARSIASVESMKTIAFEIAEQLPVLSQGTAPHTWEAPDWYIQAVSGGVGPIGIMKGFKELLEMGLIEMIPAMGIIQSEGCAPMVHAWKAGKAEVEAVLKPSTHITTLTTGNPGRSYSHLRSQMRDASSGVMESVSDEEAFQALHLVAKMEGLSVEPAAAVAFAGLIKLARSGTFARDQRIIVNCSGHAMPVEAHLLTPGWSQDIDTHEYALPDRPYEGLLAALNGLDQSFARNILIVDDHGDARRLIRRILETQGSYRIREAEHGSAALQAFESERPDLVILDLMMPDMDGFELIERLDDKAKPLDVPVIVVTAKDLDAEEQAKLRDRVKSWLTKGDFLGDDLVDRVDAILD